MSRDSNGQPWSGPLSDLVDQASTIIQREAGRLPSGLPGQVPPGIPGLPGIPGVPAIRETLTGIAGRVCPVTGAAVPLAPPDKSRLRQQAHELIEALLGSLATEGTYQHPAPYENQVPLIECVAPVDAGGTAVARMHVANDEDAPADVGLYCTNFVADSGYELPSTRVTVSPRRTTIPARGHAEFEISIAVPSQTPAGFYSALVQATGCKYVKAVLSTQVR
jgi:hypothetical protein